MGASYSLDLKQQAIELHLVFKMGPKQIADHLGLPNHQTVSLWLKPIRDANKTPRADSGHSRIPKSPPPGEVGHQGDMFECVEPKKEGKRGYTPPQINKAADRASTGLEPYFPDSGSHQFGCGLLIPAFKPVGMHNVTKREGADVADAVINRLVELFRVSEGLKRLHDYRAKVFPKILSSLFVASAMGHQVTYSRDNNIASSKDLKAIDWLGRAGFIDNHIQPPQPGTDERVSSWMCARDQLKALFNLEGDKWKIITSSDFVPVEYRERDKKGAWKSADLPLKHKAEAKRAAVLVTRYNKAIEAAEVRYGPRSLVCYLRRSFNGSMDRGGRFYGGEQETMKSKYRQHITINGEATREIDYSALHPQLLLWLTNGPLCDDPYHEIEKAAGLSREQVKPLMLRFINNEEESRFRATVTKSGNPKVKAAVAKADKARDDAKGQGIKAEAKTPVEKGFIKGVPDGYTGQQFMDALLEAFPTMADMMGGDTGLTLQWHDSQIMETVLARCLDVGIIGLPVHDSVIVPESRADEAAEIMQSVYTAYTNRHIPLK